MKRGLVLLGVLASILLVGSFCFAGITDCYDATCRIRCSDGTLGTGCTFEISQGYVFVLTNQHVVAKASSVQCSFWFQGHESVKIGGKMLACSTQVDAAVIVIPEGSFNGRLPKVIPVAPRNTRLEVGESIISVGCAKGAWATGFKGHVLGYEGKDLIFTPSPADGRSGSAIFNAEGTQIIGLIWGRTNKGHAVTVENLYRALNFKQTSAGKWKHSPEKVLNYGDALCGPDGCQILPYRRNQNQRDLRQEQGLRGLDLKLNNIYPTLPRQGPSVDLQIGPRLPILPPGIDVTVKKKTEWPTGVAFPIAVAGSGLAAFILGFLILAILNLVKSVKGGRK